MDLDLKKKKLLSTQNDHNLAFTNLMDKMDRQIIKIQRAKAKIWLGRLNALSSF